MLIYQKKNNEYYVTEVIVGFMHTNVQTTKTNLKKIYHKHRNEVEKIGEETVYVTGDTSMVGGGHQPEYVYKHILLNQGE